MSRERLMVGLLCANLVAVGGAVGQGVAQRPIGLARLNGRVPEALQAQVTALVDSAVALGLPAEPLIDKTLEGVSKGADDRRILTAVRAVAAALGTARNALGRASRDELAAGASALRAGVSPETLTGVRRALPGRPLVVPLSVLEALVVQGAPAATATAAVVAYAKRHDDSHMLAFGRTVAGAIAAGVPPEAAVSMATVSPGGVTVPATMGGGGKPAAASSAPKPKP